MAERPTEDEIEITLDMIRAGVGEYFAWNSEEQEIEELVAAIYFAMAAELPKPSDLTSQSPQ